MLRLSVNSLFFSVLLLHVILAIGGAPERLTNDINEDGVREKLSEVLSMQQKMYKSLQQTRAELKILKTYVSPVICRAPWESFGGMCLIFNSKLESWIEAEKFCVAKGGHLVWIRQRTEHNVIRNFVLANDIIGYFWIGLYRDSSKNESFVWSSGIVSDFRGKPFTDEQAKFFSADSRDKQVRGYDVLIKLPSVCRIQTDRENTFATILPMLLEAKAGETWKNVSNSQIVIIARTAKMIADLSEKLQMQRDKCPPPWQRSRDMCLLYIFQLKSWPEAQDMCTLHGGSLVWFENEREHNFIRSLIWTPHKQLYRWFWIGLHRDLSGKLIWSGYSNSSYRGSPFVDLFSNYFGADYKSTRISGADTSKRLSAVCRRLLL